MKATLEFDLDEPAEEEQLRSMLDHWKSMSVLRDLDNYLRNIEKHGDDENPSVSVASIRRYIANKCEDHNINIWG